uniref:Uncharacterized protein n=1 Tax=Hyaloperonospora arabidopsidis (strain Emoy2) TaxID=559515 RepID=M4BRY0_HYAAE
MKPTRRTVTITHFLYSWNHIVYQDLRACFFHAPRVYRWLHLGSRTLTCST